MIVTQYSSLPLGLTGFPRGAGSLKDKQESFLNSSAANNQTDTGPQERETSLTATCTYMACSPAHPFLHIHMCAMYALVYANICIVMFVCISFIYYVLDYTKLYILFICQILCTHMI